VYTPGLASIFEGVVTISSLAGVGLAAWALRGAQDRGKSRARPTHQGLALFFHPLAQLLFVCGLILANQILCHAYVLRVHGGDPRFVTRWLGPRWFAMASQWDVVRFVAAHVGDGRWLAPTVLRVQAFLELPFTVFAYLTVARMLGRDLHRRLVRLPLLVFACVSFSITFSLVEIALRNPWTNDDLVLRALAAVVTPVWVALASRLEGRAEDEARPSGIVGFVAFLAGAGAVAYIVLAAYDALLLYNLAHLPRYAGGMAAAIGIAAGASWAAPRVDRLLVRSLPFGGGRAPSAAIDALTSALAVFTTAFFVPSLSLRYWGGHASAVLAGVLLVVGSALAGLALAAQRAGGALAQVRLFLGAAIGVVAGVLAAAWAARSTTVVAGYGLPELVLARATLAFLAAGACAFRAFEVSWPAHEAKAEADQT
jgi:hypothetical protein